jgi:hypothetical protein
MLLSAFFVFVGVAMLLTLPAQVAEDRAYYEQFKAAASYRDQHGRLPPDSTVTTNPALDCEPSFAKAKSDRFVLSFWRGEWSECYAHPSGRTTLPANVWGYLRGGLGLNLVLSWLIAIAAAWGAFRLRRTESLR